ncbi:hypothetical protein KSP40_PGU019508 [Platanthera guangdongensis]|uniref:Eukaryotic translation initiation factor 3 subunit M n=1 Tax=Platanthera guangdongensis TaxID=2320717 RepID=A0ABR2N2V9_9ASPA
MSTIVPTSEDDPVLSVARLTSELAWADAGPEVAEPQVTSLCIEAQECMVSGRWVELASLMLTSAELITSKVSEKACRVDMQQHNLRFLKSCSGKTSSAFLLSYAPLQRELIAQKEALEMTKLISTKIIQQPNDKPALRLKILFSLYNLLEDPRSRFFVYIKSLNLAVNGKVTESIIPSFKMMNQFLQEWNIGNDEQRDLFLTISNILRDNKSTSKELFTFLSKYLTTFSLEEALTTNEEKEEAVHAIIEFVKSPDMFHCDLPDMPAIAQLQNDEKYALAYQLLEIFLTKRLDSYIDFYSANSNFLKSYGLVHEDCITKMRLMSLIDLSCNESGEIPYSQVKEVLRIKDDEVEYWVVKAIMSKVLDCKIDQLNQLVIVSRRTERIFGLSQWQALRSKLAVWRGNIAGVISTIQSSKLADYEGAQSMQQGILTR